MSSASVFLQPSRVAPDGDSEGGAPTTLFDAQALGAVIVATTHADIPFVVDRSAAYLAAEQDDEGLAIQLDAALSDRRSWLDRSRAGRVHVEANHAPQVVISQLERSYDVALEISGLVR